MRILPVWSPQDPLFISYLYIMARIKLSPLVTQISGSIGGVTIQRNKYGISMRQKPFPLNPASIAQYNVRQKIVSIQLAWQSLTDAQRLQWSRFLDFSGQSINSDRSVRLSGHTLYLKYQLFRLLTGHSLLTTLTYIPLPAVPEFHYFNVSGGLLLLHFTSAIDASDYVFLIKVTIPRQPNASFSKRGLRFMSCTYTDTFTFQIQDPYIAAFGALPAIGDVIHYSLRWFSLLAPVYGGEITGVTTLL